MVAWQSTAKTLPPEGKVVSTAIIDSDGERNTQDLRRIGKLWFFPDESMYVYYEPTHWKESPRAHTK